MDAQAIISSGLSDIAMALVSMIIGLAGYYLKKHFTAKQLITAANIAAEAVNFATQAAKKHGISLDLGKYNAALSRAKELAAKAGINLTDSQWETLIESAHRKAKNELESLVGTATPYTQDEIVKMIQSEVSKLAPGVPADEIVGLIKQELGNLSVSITPSVSTPAMVTDPVPTADAQAASVS